MAIGDETPCELVEVEIRQMGKLQLGGEFGGGLRKDRGEQDRAVGDTFGEVVEHGGEPFLLFRILVEFSRFHAFGVAVAMDHMAADRFESA